jgi:hypothetical protein
MTAEADGLSVGCAVDPHPPVATATAPSASASASPGTRRPETLRARALDLILTSLIKRHITACAVPFGTAKPIGTAHE